MLVTPLHRLIYLYSLRDDATLTQISKRTGWREEHLLPYLKELHTTARGRRFLLYEVLDALPKTQIDRLSELRDDDISPIRRKVLRYVRELARLTPPIGRLKAYAFWREYYAQKEPLCTALVQGLAWGLSINQMVNLYGGTPNSIKIMLGRTLLEGSSLVEGALHYAENRMGEKERSYLAQVPLVMRTTRGSFTDKELLKFIVPPERRAHTLGQLATELGVNRVTVSRRLAGIARNTGVPTDRSLLSVLFLIHSK